MPDIILKLNQMMDSFTPAEQKAASYILSNLKTVVGLSVEELAQRSGASQAAIVRFCKSAGFKGYRELSILLASELAIQQNGGSVNDDYNDINEGDDVDTIIRNVAYHNAKAIEDSLSLTDAALIEEAADILNASKYLHFYGLGASSIVAEDAQYKFMRINKYATAYKDPHLQIASAVNMGADGVAVIISWSGETREVVEAARLAKASGATVISITKLGKTSLDKYSDIHFGLSAPEATIRAGATSSRIAQMNLIDMLFYTIVSKNYKSLREYLENSRTEVQKEKRSRASAEQQN